jgi:outer membrane protein assembly factor BamB
VAPPEEVVPGRRSGRAGATLSGAPGSPLTTYLDALCFTDANGDDALDAVVWMDGETHGRVVAVDGRTGRGLWASTLFKKPDALACASRDTVLAAGEEDAALRALDARTGKERWSAKLPAVPDEVVAGDGCVTVLMKDGAVAGLKLQGGEPVDCASAPQLPLDTGPIRERKRNPQLARAGDIEVVLTARTPGPPALSAEGRRDGASVWKAELPARAPVSIGRPDLFLVASGGSALVVGVDQATGAELRLLALDPATGAVRYDRSASYLGARVAAVKGSGPYVYILSGAALRAVDPATGGAVWRATMPPRSL